MKRSARDVLVDGWPAKPSTCYTADTHAQLPARADATDGAIH